MSEQQLYGIEEREQSAGYEKLPVLTPLPKEETFGDAAPAPDNPYRGITPEEAAEALVQQRLNPQDGPVADEPAEQPALVRDYNWMNGEHAGERMPANQTVSAEQAAFDLANQRDAEALAAKNAEDQQLKEALTGEQPQPAVEQPQVAQPETPSQPEDRTQKVRRMLQDPDFLAAAADHVGGYEKQAQEATAQVQQIIQHNAEATAAAMLASFPELQGVSTQSLPAVIEAISKTNPQRGAEITNFIQRTRSIMEQAAASRSYQEQQHRAQLEQGARQMQQRFQADANFADSQYDEYVKSQGIPDQQQKAIKAECIQMLRESGMSDQDIYTQYHTNPMFRSFGAQKMMMESALYRMSRRSLGERVARKPVPPVQRPGASGEIASARDYSTRELSARLSYSGSLKDAAALLVARRKG